jgi:hypothetical protein
MVLHTIKMLKFLSVEYFLTFQIRC